MIEALKRNNISVNQSGLNNIFESLNKNGQIKFEEFKKLFEKNIEHQ